MQHLSSGPRLAALKKIAAGVDPAQMVLSFASTDVSSDEDYSDSDSDGDHVIDDPAGGAAAAAGRGG